MGKNTESLPEPSREGSGGGHRAPRELLWAALGFVSFVAISFGVLVYLNRAESRHAAGDDIVSPTGEEPIEIVLVHTNDTWGYLDPCG